MIRAGRWHLVRTLADIAAQQGIAVQTLINSGRLRAEGFPAGLSAGRTRLYDGEQVDAYFAGRPVPSPPMVDDDEDLLGRQEAAALRGMDPAAWDRRKKDPAVSEHLVLVGGVELWPRRLVWDYTPTPRRPGSGGGGRPAGVGDQVPRDLLPARVEQLLDDDPTLTAAGVTEQLGVHRKHCAGRADGPARAADSRRDGAARGERPAGRRRARLPSRPDAPRQHPR
ncbi:hypothetical protein [Streptomyces sp. NPDC046832]|uniref:hypothetical protein n=1 Tax=Streptomyces sp. NPDC046832 TaxID=3155020 RepID=UPI0033F22434